MGARLESIFTNVFKLFSLGPGECARLSGGRILSGPKSPRPPVLQHRPQATRLADRAREAPHSDLGAPASTVSEAETESPIPCERRRRRGGRSSTGHAQHPAHPPVHWGAAGTAREVYLLACSLVCLFTYESLPIRVLFIEILFLQLLRRHLRLLVPLTHTAELLSLGNKTPEEFWASSCRSDANSTPLVGFQLSFIEIAMRILIM